MDNPFKVAIALILGIALGTGIVLSFSPRPKLVEVRGDYKVEFLFEKDGVRVYRFLDYSKYHYFTSSGDIINENEK